MASPLIAILAGMLFTAPAASAAETNRTWDTAPFEAEPRAVVEAVAKLPSPKGADVENLLREETYRFDAQRCLFRSSHRVYRVFTKEAVEESGFIEGIWSPWNEERPVLRARVITPDGEVHWLEAKSIGEVPVDQDSPLVTSDRRTLRAPLPAVCVGAIVETEVSIQEVQPFFVAGVVHHVPLCSLNPTHRIRVRVESPEASALRYVVRGTDVQPTLRKQGGSQILLLEMEPKGTLRALEGYKPPEMPLWPELVFSNGESWSAVANHYAELVERQIDQESVESLVRDTVGKEQTPEQVVRKLLSRLHEMVRYVGIEFGEASIVPRTPREVLARRYGDCKDQAALLVAMLRVAGIDAEVALLSAGRGPDVASDMPGLGVFNHAIVYLPKMRLWIDPTARYVEPGKLPWSDQGRWALVAIRGTQALTQTPSASYRDNVLRETYELHMAAGNACRVRETTYVTGSMAEDLRYWYGTRNAVDLRKATREYGKSTYYAGELVTLKYTPPDELSKPFELTMEFAGASLGQSGSWGVQYTFSPARLFNRLPRFFTQLRTKEEQQEAEEGLAPPLRRQAPLVITEPHRRELTYRFVPPQGCVLRQVPTGSSHRFGPARVSQEYRLDGPVLVCSYRLDTGAGRFTAAEADAFREGIAKLGIDGDVSRWEIKLWFDDVSQKDRTADVSPESLPDCRQAIAREPGVTEHHLRYSRALLAAGLGEAAQEAASRAVELAPNAPEANALLAVSFAHNPMGSPLVRGMRRDAAITAWQRAIQLEPDNGDYRFRYATLLQHDDNGVFCARKADVDRAIAELRKARQQAQNRQLVDIGLAAALFTQERCQESLESLSHYPEATPFTELRLAITAVQDGPVVAERRSAKLCPDPQKRRALLEQTAQLLGDFSYYSQQSSIVEAAAALAGRQLRRPVVAPRSAASRVRRVELTEAPQTPKGLVERALALLLYHTKAPGLLDAYFSAETPRADRDSATDDLWKFARPCWLLCHARALRPQRAADLVSLIPMIAEGDDATGYRVRMRDGTNICCSFILKEANEYHLVGPGPKRSNLAAVALKHLERDEQAKARTWLSWAYEENHDGGSSFNPASGTPFGQLWRIGQSKDNVNLRLIAATLLAEGHDAKRALELMTAAQKTGIPDWCQLQVERASAIALLKAGEPREAMKTMKRLLNQSPGSLDLALFVARSLQMQGVSDQARSELRTWLPRFANDPAAQEILARYLADLGDFNTANQVLRSLASRGTRSPLVYNSLAWNAIVEGKADESILTCARKAVELAREEPWALHTLATVCAELDKPQDAMKNLRLAVRARGQVIEPSDWYVMGRIAEHYELYDWAAKYYRRVPSVRHPATSIGLLAAQRLSEIRRRRN